MAGEWALLASRSPLNTSTGTGSYGQLTRASGISMTFPLEDAATLSFTLPGNLLQSAQIVPLQTDVLAVRDDKVVQRFRVVSRQMEKSGVLTATYSCVSYRALLDAWVVHDADTRSWATATEQTAVAWTIISEGQSRASGGLGITRGQEPTTLKNRQLRGDENPEGSGTYDAWLAVGKSRGEAVRELAELSDGFHWDIEPDPANPYTALVFNTWAKADGGRDQFTATSPARSAVVLDGGGSTLQSWSHTVTPSEYANVLYMTGSDGTTPVWEPAEDPTGTPDEGRWERVGDNSDLTEQVVLQEAAEEELERANSYAPEISCELRPDRWGGPDALWIGDTARLILTEAVEDSPDGPEDWAVYVDEDVTVHEVAVSVADSGGETVSVALNRPFMSSLADSRGLYDRVRRLERR